MKRCTTKQFIERSLKVHGDKYDYSLVEYKNNKNKVKIICSIHGEFEQVPSSHLNGIGCKICSNQLKSNKMTKTQSQFIDKCVSIHDDKYDYSLMNYTSCYDKVKIICPIHGVFEQTAYHHTSGCGCPKCIIITTDVIIDRFREVHHYMYDYSLVNYIDMTYKVKIICSVHGEFEQLPNNHLHGNGCPKCNISKGEAKIYQLLIDNEVFFNKEHSYDDLVGTGDGLLRFDFYIPSINTCIEYDGEFHYKSIVGSNLQKQQFHDKLKDEYCNNNNIQLIRISYTQFDDINEILSNYL